MKYLIILLCALSCTLMSCRHQSGKKQTTETSRPLRYYKGHIVVGIWGSLSTFLPLSYRNTVKLANDSTYCTVRVTDYEISTISLGDTVK